MSGDIWHNDTCHVTHGMVHVSRVTHCMRTCVLVTHVGHMASHVSDTWQAMCQVHVKRDKSINGRQFGREI